MASFRIRDVNHLMRLDVDVYLLWYRLHHSRLSKCDMHEINAEGEMKE